MDSNKSYPIVIQNRTDNNTEKDVNTRTGLIPLSFKCKPIQLNKIDTNKPFYCDLCGKSFKQKVHMITHKRIHTGEKPFTCDFCEKSFSDKGALIIHTRIHTGNKPYICDTCNKAFTASGQLAIHKRSHTGEKPYSCDMCNKSFSVNGSLVQHKRIHTGEKPYFCEVCNKSFSQSSELVKHKRSKLHLSMEESKNTDYTMKEEMDEDESVNDPSSYTIKNNKSNKNRIDNNTKKDVVKVKKVSKTYQCDVCEKIFKRNHHLKSHKLIHSGDNIETGSRLYQCDVCEKTFKLSHHLKSHKVTHSGEKAYSCDVCGKPFSRKDTLNRHKKVHSTNSVKVENIKEELKEEESVYDPLSIKQEIIGDISSDGIQKVIKEEVFDDTLPFNHFTERVVKQEIKEEVKESDEGQGVDDSILDSDHPVDCSQYVQVQLNLTK